MSQQTTLEQYQSLGQWVAKPATEGLPVRVLGDEMKRFDTTFPVLDEQYRPDYLPAIQEKVEKPQYTFRSYTAFLSSMLNPQKFRSITLRNDVRDIDQRWFSYQCFRRPNTFSGKIRRTGANIHWCVGIRGGGKSALLKNLASSTHKIIGVYGARDDEVLDLLRMYKYFDGRFEKGLIVRPASVDVKSSWNTVTYDSLTLNDIEKHDIIVAPQKLFPKPELFFQGTQRILDIIWTRPSIDKTWGLLVLEAANVIYSRMFLKRANIEAAKAYLILLIREMRHVGVAMFLDSQRGMALDKEVREQSDYTYLKNMGSFSLPGEMKWVYKYLVPRGMRAMYPNEFACIDKWGGTYLGRSMLPPWHKNPHEDIYKSLGITFEKSDNAIDAVFNEAGEEDVFLHNEIMNVFYGEGNQKIKTTARLTNHDRATVQRHVKLHLEKKCSHFEGEQPQTP